MRQARTPIQTEGDIGVNVARFRRHLRTEHVNPNTETAYTGAVDSSRAISRRQECRRGMATIRRDQVEALITDLSNTGRGDGEQQTPRVAELLRVADRGLDVGKAGATVEAWSTGACMNGCKPATIAEFARACTRNERRTDGRRVVCAGSIKDRTQGRIELDDCVRSSSHPRSGLG